MGSFSAPPRRTETPLPTQAPPGGGWFAQNNVAPAPMPAPAPALTDTNRGSTSPTNGTMPVASPQAPQAPQSGAPAQRNTGDPLARIEELQGQYAPTPEGFRQILAQLQREGYPVVAATHNGGNDMSDDAIVLPDGRVFDIISAVGSPGASWSLQHTDNYDPSRNVVTPAGEMTSFSSYLQGAGLPASTAVPFARPSGGGGGGAMSPAGSVNGTAASGNWQAGMDPSYGFRFGEGLKALERSAAAKGTLLTGGTLKGLLRYGQDMASTEYGNVFDRNYKLAGLGLNATNNAANLGSSYSGQVGNQSSNFGNELGNLANNQAGNNAGLTQGQINNLTNLITGQGNVNAAGQIGSANAQSGTLAWLANLIGQGTIRNP